MKRTTVHVFYLALGLAALWPDTGSSQAFSSIRTRWSDSFVEWELLGYEDDLPPEDGADSEEMDEVIIGDLQLRWLNVRDDWSEWDFRLGEERGTIRMKWKDNPTEWELRTYNGDVVTMRAAWAGDLSEWRVTDNSLSLQLRSRWTNQFDEWLVDDPTYGRFYLYTFRRQDPRDWAIEDRLAEKVTPAMKLALIFLTVFHGTPRM
jgi:hypothetical protein